MDNELFDQNIIALQTEALNLQQRLGELDSRQREGLKEVLAGFLAALELEPEHPILPASPDPVEREPYLALFDVLPGLIWRSALDGKCNYFNQSWLAFTGRTLEQEIGLGWAEGIYAQDRDWVVRRYLDAIEARQPFEMEYRLRHHSGEYRWILDVGRPYLDLQGKFAGYMGNCYDLTEQKNIEKALQDKEALFKGLFEYAPDAVVAVNDQGEILLINQQAEELFGYPRQELAGKPIEFLMPEDFQKRHRKHVAHYIHQPRVRPMGANLALSGRRRDGSRFPVDIMLGPLLMGSEMVVLATIRDTTERRQVEEELKVYREHLEELVASRTSDLQMEILRRRRAEAALHSYTHQLARSNRELQDFASIASHDLQEPLRKIQAFGDRLKLKYEAALGDEGRDYLERIQNAAARMQIMLNDLLVYSRLATRAQPLSPVDLGQIAAEVVSDLEVRIEETGGQVDLGELPTIEADALQMRQLFQNLIGNALKFHSPGVPPRVRVHARKLEDEGLENRGAGEKGRGDKDEKAADNIPYSPHPLSPTEFVEIRVEDNGIGFDEQYLNRIFQPFQRLHGRDDYEGTGMGLAICRKIVERHRGKLTARSRPGQGTAFLVVLPVRQVTEEDNPPPSGT